MSRKVYHYDKELGKMVEGPAAQRGQVAIVGDEHYAQNPFKAHDGTIIDSKNKHRAYMKRHDLTTADDFTKTWENNAKNRANFYQGKDKAVSRERTMDIVNAYNQITRRK